MTHCSAPASALKFFARVGRATFTTDPSTKAKADARIVVIRTRFGCVTVGEALAQCAAAESHAEGRELNAGSIQSSGRKTGGRILSSGIFRV